MHLEALQGSFLAETNVCLGYSCYFGGHLGCGIKMTLKHNFNARNGFVAPKLVGLEVLQKFLCYIVQNLGIPPIQDGHQMPSWITKKAYTENDREYMVLDFRHLQATFLKKSAF